jgi:hypothetical protein
MAVFWAFYISPVLQIFNRDADIHVNSTLILLSIFRASLFEILNGNLVQLSLNMNLRLKLKKKFNPSLNF